MLVENNRAAVPYTGSAGSARSQQTAGSLCFETSPPTRVLLSTHFAETASVRISNANAAATCLILHNRRAPWWRCARPPARPPAHSPASPVARRITMWSPRCRK
ncbi:hypothetical protein SKAU_G00058910 [Synaphobranchus kaupii]|uniref:Uncharacterized protein n=1 Tax=Synaphobranchus kaupii TaxID=118154 RepID=A0A9Q1G4Z0_SYNKA|nr:hypothetical protein SKAU_G00058910 [Synaphobranchus kaupii]